MPTQRWLLIDGYNLLYASGVFGSGGRTPLESAREALLDWLGDVLNEAERRRTTIVFDASQAPPGLPNSKQKYELSIRFAPRGCEADDLLEELIRQHSAPRSLTVVSSDHRIHRSARRRRAVAIDSERWVAEKKRRAKRVQTDHVRRDRNIDVPLTGEELQDWLKEFADEQ